MKKYSLQFWLLCLSGLLFFSSFSMMIPDLPSYLTSMGGGNHIGLIISLFTITALISRPFSGKLADRWGRIPVMILGALVSGLAGLFYPIALTVPLFFVIRLFHGFSTGFKPTGTAAYVADIVPKNNRGEAMGYLGFCSNLGTIIGFTAGPYITQHYSINTMFFISSTLAVFSVLVLARMKETLANRSRFSRAMLKIKWSDIIEPRVIPPSTVLFFTVSSLGAILTLGPILSDRLGVSSRGLGFLVYLIASLVVRIIAGKTSDKFGRVPVLKASIPVLTLAITIIGTADTQLQFFIACAFMGLGNGVLGPTLYAWTIDLSSDQNRGRGIATMYIFLEAGIGLGAGLTGYVFTLLNNNYLLSFSICGIFSLIALIYLYAYKKHSFEEF